MTGLLRKVMEAWFHDGHPGGALAVCREPDKRFKSTNLRSVFRKFFKRNKWAVLRGYHVLRHSFASNLASAGTDQRVIDELMGHQTEELRKRYRHLFPKQREDAVRAVFG